MERVKPDSLLDILRLYKSRKLITVSNSSRLDPILDTSNRDDILSPLKTQFGIILSSTDRQREHAVAQLVEALRYKPEGRGFDSRWCQWNFSLT